MYFIFTYLSYLLSRIPAFSILLERQKLETSRRQSLQGSTASSVFEDSFISPRSSSLKGSTPSNFSTGEFLKPSAVDGIELPMNFVGSEQTSAFSTVPTKVDGEKSSPVITNEGGDSQQSNDAQEDLNEGDAQNGTVPKFKIHADIFQCHNANSPQEQDKLDESKEDLS